MLTIAQTLAVLDDLADAARSDNLMLYHRALTTAQTHGVTVEQITDAYQWGRRGMGAGRFDTDGQTFCSWCHQGMTPDQAEGVWITCPNSTNGREVCAYCCPCC